MDTATAEALFREARESWEAQEWQRSASAYERLLAAFPDGESSPGWWFDAALAYKHLRNWPKAYELGLQAAARAERGVSDPAFWNLGIAATVLREWETAREAWTGYGVTIPPGAGPIEGQFGSACVRIDTGGGQEVVWARRLCPTRARVINVPFAASRRFGEVVLHDGVPNGERMFQDRSYPVFDEILLFEPSAVATASVTVHAPAEDVSALCLMFDEHPDMCAEPLSSGVVLCKCCSEGTITQERTFHAGEQVVLIAAPLDTAAAMLDRWRDERPQTRSWTNLHLAT